MNFYIVIHHACFTSSLFYNLRELNLCCFNLEDFRVWTVHWSCNHRSSFGHCSNLNELYLFCWLLSCMYVFDVNDCVILQYEFVFDINDCVSLGIYLSWLFHLLTHMVWPFCSWAWFLLCWLSYWSSCCWQNTISWWTYPIWQYGKC